MISGVCAYCQKAPAVNRDHVIPKSLQKRLARRGIALSADLCATVPACFACNLRKSTRKLVPPSWADRIPALKAVIPGQWRVWDGSVSSPAFSQAWTR